MSAYTISNSFDPVHREQREKSLESVLRNYNPEERRRLTDAFRELMKQIQLNVDRMSSLQPGLFCLVFHL